MRIIIYGGGEIEASEGIIDAESWDAPHDDYYHYDPCQPSTMRMAQGTNDGADYNRLQSTTDWTLGAGLFFLVALVLSAAVVGGLLLFGVI